MHMFCRPMPPELVAIILHNLVCADLRDAWLARGVCSTFRDVIEDDITMYQSKEVLRQSKDIMAHVMPRYLAQRSKRLLDVDDTLPTRVNNMMNYLCAELHIVTAYDREACLGALCKGLVDVMGYFRVANILWDRSNGLFRGFPSLALTSGQNPHTLLQHNLMAAMVARLYNLVCAQIPHVTDISFEIDWEPLVVAVRLKDDRLLQVILDSIGEHANATWANFSAVPAVDNALKEQNVVHALAIIDGIQYSSIRLDEATCNRWLAIAIEIGVACLVEATLRVRSHTYAKITPKQFQETCKAKKYDLAILFLEHMDISKGTPKTLPLHVAIRTQNPNVIAAVLNAGADINQCVYNNGGSKTPKIRSYKCPVEVAMRCGAPVLKLILERGAMVPPLRRWVKERRAYDILRDESFIRNEKKRFPPYADFQRMTAEAANRY